MDWNGSVAIITGASRGIGAAVARAAVAKGARIGLIARAKDELEALLDECGGNGAVAAADVSDRAAVEDAIASLERDLGQTDILVNNAGIGAYGFVWDTDVETFEQLMRVNYLGTIYATKAVLPSMLSRGAGHIHNVASIAGRVGAPLEAAYSATKFAVAGFTEALALECASRGVEVSMIDPGPVSTDFFRARGHEYGRSYPKPVRPEAVASKIVSLVQAGGGEAFVPRWLRFPPALKAMVPAAYRKGTLRDYREELR